MASPLRKYEDYSYEIKKKNGKTRNAEIYDWEYLRRRKQLKEAKWSFAIRFKLVVSVILVFAGTLCITASFAIIKHQQTQVVLLGTELQDLQNGNLALREEISHAIDLTYIDEYARANLNMAPPEAYQIIYINTPHDSYTITHETPPSEKEETLIAGLWSLGWWSN